MVLLPHPNERVELPFQVLQCRRKLRQKEQAVPYVQRLAAELERLEKRLQELDE